MDPDLDPGEGLNLHPFKIQILNTVFVCDVPFFVQERRKFLLQELFAMGPMLQLRKHSLTLSVNIFPT